MTGVLEELQENVYCGLALLLLSISVKLLSSSLLGCSGLAEFNSKIIK